MQDLVQRQLQESLSTFQRVLADKAIADAVVRAGEITAKAMLAGRKQTRRVPQKSLSRTCLER